MEFKQSRQRLKGLRVFSQLGVLQSCSCVAVHVYLLVGMLVIMPVWVHANFFFDTMTHSPSIIAFWRLYNASFLSLQLLDPVYLPHCSLPRYSGTFLELALSFGLQSLLAF